MRNTIKKILKENDFDWTKDTEPISVEQIEDKIDVITDYGVNNWFLTRIATKIYGLGLLNKELNLLTDIMKELAENSQSHGVQLGWEEGNREGFNEGWRKKEKENEMVINYAKDEVYDEGYADGLVQGIEDGKIELEKDLKEREEIIYNKGFEEGRMYEAGLDSEEYERKQSGLDFEYEN